MQRVVVGDYFDATLSSNSDVAILLTNIDADRRHSLMNREITRRRFLLCKRSFYNAFSRQAMTFCDTKRRSQAELSSPSMLHSYRQESASDRLLIPVSQELHHCVISPEKLYVKEQT